MKQYSSLHLMGIGGAGMSGIAHILLNIGVEITGSDVTDSARIQLLRQQGARIFIGHDPSNILNPQAVVVSSAISPDNWELLEAKQRGIPIVGRAQMLGELMTDYYGIAIAGTHGKTTTTSMIGLLLTQCGADPVVAIGGEARDLGSNVRIGQGPYFVAEADESDGSFLQLNPRIGIVTNIEADHLEHYGSLQAIIKAFEAFLDKIPANGLAILCHDDPQIRQLISRKNVANLSYGLEPGGDLQGTNMELTPTGGSCDVCYHGKLLGKLELTVPGKHNILNALAAVVVGYHLGFSFEEIAKSLKSFSGADRRFHILGSKDDVLVVDDYAHHPTEIKATLAAAQTLGRRVIAVFQPHRYTRTFYLADELANSFAQADIAILTEIYSAMEKPIPGISGEMLAEKVAQTKGGNVHYLANLHSIPNFLNGVCQPGDLVITMGAGNICQVAVLYLNQKTETRKLMEVIKNQ